MKSVIGKTALAAALVVGVLAALTALTRSEAIAQIRAALVKNVDEPGRTPWETRSQFLPNAGGCYGISDCFNYVDSPGFAMFDLRPIPAGKRWVVQMASGGLINAVGRTTQIELTSNRGGLVFDGSKWFFAGPYSPGVTFNPAIFSANLFATFGPGETPTVRVQGSPALSGYSLVFSGYLIDATN